MLSTKALFLIGSVIALVGSVPLASKNVSPCPGIFQYEEVSETQWKARVTVTSDVDLSGVWIRLLTKPKLVDVKVSDNYQVKEDENSAQVRLYNREDYLKENVPRTITATGKIVNGEVPELISVILNGKLICTSGKHDGSVFFGGDIRNDKFLSSLSRIPNKIKPSNFKCGKNLLPNSVLPNDNIKVLPSSWPWQASIFKGENKNSSFLCEATLISPNSLITSAHCVSWKASRRPVQASLLIAKLKSLNLEDSNEEDVYFIKNIIIHPYFNENTLENDLAIVQLEEPVNLDDSTQPICLPNSATLPEEAFILGYGFKKDGSLYNLGISKTVPIDEKKCLELEPAYQPLINEDNFCSTYVQDHDICVGSSGSPVMDVKSESEPIWELKGVTSIGRGLLDKFSCNQKSPVLIVDVSKHLKWISNNIY